MAEPNFKVELLALMKREDLGNKSVYIFSLGLPLSTSQRLVVPMLTRCYPWQTASIVAPRIHNGLRFHTESSFVSQYVAFLVAWQPPSHYSASVRVCIAASVSISALVFQLPPCLS